jgi:hypothetical protein
VTEWKRSTKCSESGRCLRSSCSGRDGGHTPFTRVEEVAIHAVEEHSGRCPKLRLRLRPGINPASDTRKALAFHALRLARIDPSSRSMYVDPEPEKVEASDVDDVVELLRNAP